MGKVEDKKKQKSDTLFFSAFNLFTSKGFNETTIADIVKEAGVAKGTFYLYFKDKYDLREKLIAYKASILFQNALDAYLKSELVLEEKVRDIEGKMIFFVDNVINQLKNNRPLMRLISKDLSWGVYKHAFSYQANGEEFDFYNVYKQMLDKARVKCEKPDILLFSIIDLTGSTCYSSIMFNEPLPIDEYKPYLYKNIRAIISANCIYE
jgi:AcrR family transcriptional regulator